MKRFQPIWLLLVGVLFVSSTGCAARQHGPNEPAPGEIWVRELKIEGAKSLDASDIKDGLVSQGPKGWIIVHKTRVDSALIERDRARIQTYYQSRGYFDAVVTAVDIKAIASDRSDVIFHVSEGARSKIAEVTVTGLPSEVPDHARDLGIDKGDGFAHSKFTAGKNALLAAARERGYAHAKVKGSALVDRRRHEVALRYEVDAGPKVHIGDIEVRGLKTIPESAVRNRLRLESGDLFSAKRIADSQTSIRSLDRFGVVRIDFQDQAPSATGDLVVTVTEAPRQEVRLGGGLGFDRDNFKIRSRAEYTLHGVIDPLVSLSTQLRPAYAIVRGDTSQREFVGEASTSLTRQDLFWPLAQGTGTLGYDIDVFEGYSSRGGNALLSLSRPLWERRVRVGVGWRLELLDFTRIEDAIDDKVRESLGFSSPYRSAFFEQSIALDLRDHPLNARDGFFASLKLEQGGGFAGGNFEYGRATPDLRAYRSISERLGFAARATLGWSLWGTLPVTRRFFSGGSTSHRGFSQRRLSPAAGDDQTGKVAIGGDNLLELMVEARVGIFKLAGEWVGLTFFADGGDVLLANDSIDLANLHWAPGLGLRYDTIVGPLRFDVGYRVNRFGPEDIQPGERLAFHFSIGEAF